MRTDFPTLLKSPDETYAEGLRFFEGKGMLNEALKRLAADLAEHKIEYSVIGAAALNRHGYKRFTADIDIILSPDGLAKFQSELVGKGYRPAFTGATKTFRETEHNVPIEIIVSGEYPGDGKPKPVRFPEPGERYVVIDSIKTVDLAKLIELKLASGLSGRGRLKDLADVQELIRVKSLGEEMAAQLDASVRDKYIELWEDIRAANEAGDPFSERPPNTLEEN